LFDLSSENEPDEISVDLSSENEPESDDSSEESNPTEISIKELSKLLELEKQKVLEHEEKLKHVLADFQNLNRKTQSDIENGVNAKVDEFILDFLKIYDDFIRAHFSFSSKDSIIRICYYLSSCRFSY